MEKYVSQNKVSESRYKHFFAVVAIIAVVISFSDFSLKTTDFENNTTVVEVNKEHAVYKTPEKILLANKKGIRYKDKNWNTTLNENGLEVVNRNPNLLKHNREILSARLRTK